MYYVFNLVFTTPGYTFDVSAGVVNFTFYSNLFQPFENSVLVDSYKIGLYSFDIMYTMVLKSKGGSKFLNYLKLTNPYEMYKEGSYYEFSVYDVQDLKDVKNAKQGREIFTIRLLPYDVKNLEQPHQIHENIVTVSMLPLAILDLVYKNDIYFKSMIVKDPSQCSLNNVMNTSLHKTEFYAAYDVPTYYFFQEKAKLNPSLPKIDATPLVFKDESVYISTKNTQLSPIIVFSPPQIQQQNQMTQEDYNNMIQQERDMLDDQLNSLDSEMNKLLENELPFSSLLDGLNNLMNDLKGLYNDIMSKVDSLKNSIINAVKSAIDSITNNLPGVNALSDFLNDITGVFNGIVNGISDIFNFGMNILNDLGSILGNIASDILNIGSLINNVLKIPGMLANYFMNLPSYLLSPLLGIIGEILSSLSSWLQSIESIANQCYQNNKPVFGPYNIPQRYQGSDDLGNLINFGNLMPFIDGLLVGPRSTLSSMQSGIMGLLGKLGLSSLSNIANALGHIPDAILQGIENAINNFPNILAPLFNLAMGILNLAKDILSIPAKLFLLGNFLDKFVKPDFLKKLDLDNKLNDTKDRLKKMDEKEQQKKKSNTIKLHSGIDKIVFTFDKEEVENSDKLNKSVERINEKTYRTFPTQYYYSYYVFLHYSNTLVPVPLLTARSFVFDMKNKVLAVRHRIYRPGRTPDYIIQVPKFFTKSTGKKDLDVKPRPTTIYPNVLLFDSNPIFGEASNLQGDENLILVQSKTELAKYVTKYKYVEIPIINMKPKGVMKKGKFKPSPLVRYKIPMEDILSEIPFVDDDVAKNLLKNRYSDDTIRIYENVGAGFYSNLPCLSLREFIYMLFYGQVIKIIHHDLEYMYKLNVGDVVELKFGDNETFSSYEGKYLVSSIEATCYNGAVGSVFNVYDTLPQFIVELVRPLPHMMNKEYAPNKGPSKFWNIGSYQDQVIV